MKHTTPEDALSIALSLAGSPNTEDFFRACLSLLSASFSIGKPITEKGKEVMRQMEDLYMNKEYELNRYCELKQQGQATAADLDRLCLNFKDISNEIKTAIQKYKAAELGG